jgi:hypothetical protein
VNHLLRAPHLAAALSPDAHDPTEPHEPEDLTR